MFDFCRGIRMCGSALARGAETAAGEKRLICGVYGKFDRTALWGPPDCRPHEGVERVQWARTVTLAYELQSLCASLNFDVVYDIIDKKAKAAAAAAAKAKKEAKKAAAENAAAGQSRFVPACRHQTRIPAKSCHRTTPACQRK